AHHDRLPVPLGVGVGGVPGAAGDLLHRLGPGRFGAGVLVEGAGAGGRDGLVDPLVGAAAAEVAGERVGDLGAAGGGVAVLGAPAVGEGGGLHHEARRAEAALQGVVRGEGALHRVVAAQP